MTTKVIFRKFKDGGDVIALFPQEPGTNDPSTCLSYQHIGQHGAASADLSAVTVLATPAEYKDLLWELKEVIGYDDLDIRQRATYKDFLIRYSQIRDLEG